MNREGLPFLAVPAGLALLLWTGFLYSGAIYLGYLAVLSLFGVLSMIYFFRDPERVIPPGDDLVVSAADGRVVDIEKVEFPDFPDGVALKVGVFLSIFDVHVNRIPFSGRVESVRHFPGRFFLAKSRRSSFENERTVIEISHGDRRVICSQIAGFFVRRIVCNLERGDLVERGERFGMIRFGSRVELLLPAEVELKVSVGEKVRAGETVIGVFPQ